MEIKFDRKEILRYMDVLYCDARLDEMIDRAEKEVISVSKPRYISKYISLQPDPSSGQVKLAGTIVFSLDLAKHLRGCSEGVLLACTLGADVDRLVKRYSITEPPMLPVIQSVSASYIELYIDYVQKDIEDQAAKKNLFLRPRYSPGYGDFELNNQRFIFDFLEITKRIGVGLTEHYLMVPTKSVTAIIGLSDNPLTCNVNKCLSCKKNNCPFRR